MVPAGALGGWGKSGCNPCSAEVSIGIARIAIQHAQVCFFSYATRENSILNIAGCLQPALFSACVKLGSKESLPCCGVTLY